MIIMIISLFVMKHTFYADIGKKAMRRTVIK